MTIYRYSHQLFITIIITIDDKILTDLGTFNSEDGYKSERVLICEEILRKNKRQMCANYHFKRNLSINFIYKR